MLAPSDIASSAHALAPVLTVSPSLSSMPACAARSPAVDTMRTSPSNASIMPTAANRDCAHRHKKTIAMYTGIFMLLASPAIKRLAGAEVDRHVAQLKIKSWPWLPLRSRCVQDSADEPARRGQALIENCQVTDNSNPRMACEYQIPPANRPMKSFTVMVSSCLRSPQVFTILSRRPAVNARSTLRSNFSSSKGRPSVRRARWPSG